MTDLPFRPFADDAAIRRIGEGLLARTLPRADWTHEAHLAATLWLIRDRPDVDVDARIAGIITRYNESVGGVNDDTQGYHDTITACIRGRHSPASRRVGTRDEAAGRRRQHACWPVRWASATGRFVSTAGKGCSPVAARRKFVGPDLAPLPTP